MTRCTKQDINEKMFIYYGRPSQIRIANDIIQWHVMQMWNTTLPKTP